MRPGSLPEIEYAVTASPVKEVAVSVWDRSMWQPPGSPRAFNRRRRSSAESNASAPITPASGSPPVVPLKIG